MENGSGCQARDLHGGAAVQVTRAVAAPSDVLAVFSLDFFDFLDDLLVLVLLHVVARPGDGYLGCGFGGGFCRVLRLRAFWGWGKRCFKSIIKTRSCHIKLLFASLLGQDLGGVLLQAVEVDPGQYLREAGDLRLGSRARGVGALRRIS